MKRHSAIVAIVILAYVASSSSKPPSCVLIAKPKAPIVPKNFTSWTRSYTHYAPVEWSVPCEEDICDTLSPEYITFGKMLNGVDRRRAKTCLTRADIKTDESGRPLNPAGRTGLSGRGMLPKWGPNHLVKLSLHKKEDHHVSVFMKSDSRVPEMFVNSPSSHWFDRKVEEGLQTYMKRLFGSIEEAEKAIRKAEKQSKAIFKGSVPSPMNTDNAWVEIYVREIDCNKHEAFCMAMESEFKDQGYGWAVVNKTKAKLLTKDKAIKVDRKVLEDYSAYCKVLLMKNFSHGHSAFLFASTTLITPAFIIGMVLLFTGPATGGLSLILLPIVTSIIYASLVSTTVYTIFAKRCS